MDADLVTRTQEGQGAGEPRLLQAAQGGDRDAFMAIVASHVAPLHALAQRLCGDRHWADDLTQEALLRAFVGISGFRAECTLRTWLFGLLVRLASEPKRWRKEAPEHLHDAVEIPDHLGTEVVDVAYGRELGDRVAEAMERLPLRQRAALHLRAVEGLDYDGIAGVLGCKAGAARMLVLEARKKLGVRLARYLEP